MRMAEVLMVTVENGTKPQKGIFTYEEFKQYCREELHISDRDMLSIAEAVLAKNESDITLKPYQLTVDRCRGESVLLRFLVDTNLGYQKQENGKLICSEQCEKLLLNHGIATDGNFLSGSVEYQTRDMIFQQGQILDNFNGERYRVMEVYQKERLLLLNERSGDFMVAYGIHYYARFPAAEKENPVHLEFGVEWQHGRYLSNVPSGIDFFQLKQEYGTDYGKKGEEFSIEIREVLSRVENVKADNLGDAIDQAMELYNDEKIVLDAEDYKGVTFIPKEMER